MPMIRLVPGMSALIAQVPRRFPLLEGGSLGSLASAALSPIVRDAPSQDGPSQKIRARRDQGFFANRKARGAGRKYQN